MKINKEKIIIILLAIFSALALSGYILSVWSMASYVIMLTVSFFDKELSEQGIQFWESKVNGLTIFGIWFIIFHGISILFVGRYAAKIKSLVLLRSTVFIAAATTIFMRTLICIMIVFSAASMCHVTTMGYFLNTIKNEAKQELSDELKAHNVSILENLPKEEYEKETKELLRACYYDESAVMIYRLAKNNEVITSRFLVHCERKYVDENDKWTFYYDHTLFD